VMESDVGDLEALKISLASINRPIRGVVHAAMVLKDGIFETMEYTDFIIPFKSKVNGLLNLQELLSQPLYKPLDFFVVLSSISGVVGTPGQSNYAAAGTFEDAFVQKCHRLGQKACVIDLGVISNIGYVSRNSEVEQKLRQSGIGSYNERQLQQLFRMAIDSELESTTPPPGQLLTNAQIITGVDIQSPETRKVQDSTWFKDPKWGILKSTASGLAADIDGTGAADGDDINALMLEKLKNADTRPKDEVIDDISHAIIRKTSSMTMIPIAEILPDHSLSRYGMDSLVAVEMRNWLLKVTSIELKVSDIMTAPSIKALAEKIYTARIEQKEKKDT